MEGRTGEKGAQELIYQEEQREETQTKHLQTEIDITGLANGTVNIKQMETVHTGEMAKE